MAVAAYRSFFALLEMADVTGDQTSNNKQRGRG
jgi:hypothetical protein